MGKVKGRDLEREFQPVSALSVLPALGRSSWPSPLENGSEGSRWPADLLTLDHVMWEKAIILSSAFFLN